VDDSINRAAFSRPTFARVPKYSPKHKKIPLRPEVASFERVGAGLFFSDSRQTHPPLNGGVDASGDPNVSFRKFQEQEEEVWATRQLDAWPIPASIRNWCKVASGKLLSTFSFDSTYVR